MNNKDAECTVCGEVSMVAELKMEGLYAQLNDFHQLRICCDCLKRATDAIHVQSQERLDAAIKRLEDLTK